MSNMKKLLCVSFLVVTPQQCIFCFCYFSFLQTIEKADSFALIHQYELDRGIGVKENFSILHISIFRCKARNKIFTLHLHFHYLIIIISTFFGKITYLLYVLFLYPFSNLLGLLLYSPINSDMKTK